MTPSGVRAALINVAPWLHPLLAQASRWGLATEPNTLVTATTLAAQATRKIPSAPGHLVAVFDGPLTADLGSALRRTPPAQLCAAEALTRKNGLELSLLSRVLQGQSIWLPELPWQRRMVHSVEELRKVAEEAVLICEAAGGNTASCTIAAEVTHELVANALLDAPVDHAGKAKYAFRRDQSFTIDASDACQFAVSVLGGRMWFAVADRFGRMTPAPLVRTIEGLGGPAKVDASGGGAGLGLRRLVEHCEALAFQVYENRRTEVVASVTIEGPRKRLALPKSLFTSFVSSRP